MQTHCWYIFGHSNQYYLSKWSLTQFYAWEKRLRFSEKTVLRSFPNNHYVSDHMRGSRFPVEEQIFGRECLSRPLGIPPPRHVPVFRLMPNSLRRMSMKGIAAERRRALLIWETQRNTVCATLKERGGLVFVWSVTLQTSIAGIVEISTKGPSPFPQA